MNKRPLLGRWFLLLSAHTVGITSTMFWVALIYEHFGLLAPIGFRETVWIYILPTLVIGSATAAWTAYK